MYKVIGIFVLVIVFCCTSKKKEKEIVIIEEEGVIENVSYADVGKLKLSDYGFFENPLSELIPLKNVFAYELNTALFTDYALKKRFVYIPEGKSAIFQKKEVLDFPIGSVLIKNFYYEDAQLSAGKGRIIETRLLIHEQTGWKALPYIWNEEQKDAFLEITGGDRTINLTDKGKFKYLIPNMAQCKSCHEINGAIAPIGPTARQLNKSTNVKNQLSMLAEADVLDSLPDFSNIEKIAIWDNEKSGSLDERARAYLEINCGHCHRPEGPGKNSGLDLTVYSTSEHSLGIYKGPVAAGAGSGGLAYDIVPGNPDASILVYRMGSNDPGVMMPELGRSLAHDEGIALIRTWIKSMK